MSDKYITDLQAINYRANAETYVEKAWNDYYPKDANSKLYPSLEDQEKHWQKWLTEQKALAEKNKDKDVDYEITAKVNGKEIRFPYSFMAKELAEYSSTRGIDGKTIKWDAAVKNDNTFALTDLTMLVPKDDTQWYKPTSWFKNTYAYVPVSCSELVPGVEQPPVATYVPGTLGEQTATNYKDEHPDRFPKTGQGSPPR